MYQGTTPALKLKVEGADLTDKTVFVTIQCGNYILTKTGDSLAVTYVDDYSVVIVRLSQRETLMMKKMEAEVQVRFIDSSGFADATNKAKFNVKDSLYKSIIKYYGGETDESADG